MNIKATDGYMGNPNLRRENTTFDYSSEQLVEMFKCATDIEYFAETYGTIVTLDEGKRLIELYDYQREMLDIMLNGDPENNKYNVIVLSPRQCISKDTEVNVDGSLMKAEDVLNTSLGYYFKSIDAKFLVSIKLHEPRYILSPDGFVEIEYVHLTKPLDMFQIETENGYILNCAGEHVVMSGDVEIFAKDCLGINIDTIDGPSKVVKFTDLLYKEEMIDFSLKSREEVYYSDGILSHNSGKCLTGDSTMRIRKISTGEVTDISMNDFYLKVKDEYGRTDKGSEEI